MNIDKRKKGFLSSIRTARSLAGIIVITGFFLIILSAAVGTLLFQSDISGADVEAILNTIAPDSEPSATAQGANQNSTASLDAKASFDAQDIKLNVSSFISSLGWNDFWRLLAASLLMLWSGYLLRVLSILAETQLIDYQSVD